MRILIDLQACQSDSRFGGIGRYSLSLAKAMLRAQSGHQFGLLLNARLPNENFIRAEFADLLPQHEIHTFYVPPFIAADNERPAHTRLAELIREKRIAEIAPDVLHISSLFEGAGEDVVTSVGLMFPAKRTVVTLYDLIPYLEQEMYLGHPVLAEHYLRKFDQMQTAGALVSISEFSRQEALEHTTLSADRIFNISSAVDSRFAPLELSVEDRTELTRKCGIDRPFVMFTGSFDARKNHVRLVKAFAKVRPLLAEPCQLVIVGKGLPRQMARLKAIARFHGLAETDLVFVGHVTDVELVALYNLSTLFVFPSLREGFGLPVLEAMSCGVATIGSNRTSVPEVIAREEALFDPGSVDDIAAKMLAVLQDPILRDDLRQHGLQQAENFSWELSARRAIEVFELLHVVSSQSAGVPAAPDPAQVHPGVYADFRSVLARLELGTVDERFLMACAHTVAANELLAQIMNPGFKPTSKVNLICPHDPDDALPNTDVDAVMIDVHDALPTWRLAQVVDRQKCLGRQTFVTLHSTEDLLHLRADDALEIRAALKSCSGIFVHSMRDVANLEAFKVRRNVNIVPRPALSRSADQGAQRSYAGGAEVYLDAKVAWLIAAGPAWGT